MENLADTTPVSSPPADSNSGVETIQKSGSGIGVSFDEFETLEALTTQESKPSGKESLKKPIKKADDSEVDEKATDDRSPEGVVDQKAGKPAKLEKNAADIKALKVTFKEGETEHSFDVPSAAMVPVKVNGELQTVPFQELVNNYSGKIHWDKKFNELNTQHQKFSSEKSRFERNIREVYKKAAEENDPLGAIAILAEAMGADPIQTVTQLQEQIGQKLAHLTDLTPEQIKAQQAEEQLKYYKQRDERLKQEQAQQQELSQLQSKAEQVQQDLGISQAELVSAYDSLIAECHKYGLDPNEVTLDHVAAYHQATRDRGVISEVIQNNFADAKNQDAIAKQLAWAIKQHPSITKEQLAELAIEAFGKPTRKRSTMAEKVIESRPKQQPPKPKQDLLSWEDL